MSDNKEWRANNYYFFVLQINNNKKKDKESRPFRPLETILQLFNSNYAALEGSLPTP
jgi:hypothetical protein